MDQTTFIDDLFGHWPDAPATTITDSAVRKSEKDIGQTLAGTAETAEARGWFENRVKYYTIQDLLDIYALDFTHGASKFSERYKHFESLLETLDNKWESDIKNSMQKTSMSDDPERMFQAVSPGFAYTENGEPVN